MDKVQLFRRRFFGFLVALLFAFAFCAVTSEVDWQLLFADDAEPDEDNVVCGPSLFYHTESIDGSSKLNLVFIGTGYMNGTSYIDPGTGEEVIVGGSKWTQPEDAPWHSIRSSIGKITFSQNMVSVSPYAFWGMDNVSTLSIPASITLIDSTALVMEGLKTVSVNKNNSHFYTDGGILVWASKSCDDESLITGTQDVKVLWAPRTGLDDQIVVPIYSTEIAPYAFYNNQTIKQIIFSDRVAKISTSAFENTKLIGAITSDWVEEIGTRAFAKSDITMAYLGTGVESLELSAFDECSGLQVIAIASNPTVTYTPATGLTDEQKIISSKNTWQPTWHVSPNGNAAPTTVDSGQQKIFSEIGDLSFSDVILIRYEPSSAPDTPVWSDSYENDTGAFQNNTNIKVGNGKESTMVFRAIQTGEKPYDNVLFTGKKTTGNSASLIRGWFENASDTYPEWMLTKWEEDYPISDFNGTAYSVERSTRSESDYHGWAVFANGQERQNFLLRYFFVKQIQYPSTWTVTGNYTFTHYMGKVAYVPSNMNYDGTCSAYCNNNVETFVTNQNPEGTSKFSVQNGCLIYDDSMLYAAPGRGTNLILGPDITTTQNYAYRGGENYSIQYANNIFPYYDGSYVKLNMLYTNNTRIDVESFGYAGDVSALYGEVSKFGITGSNKSHMVIYDSMGQSGSVDLTRPLRDSWSAVYFSIDVTSDPDYFVNLYTGESYDTAITPGSVVVKQSEYRGFNKIYDGTSYTGVGWTVVGNSLVFIYDRSQTTLETGYIPNFSPNSITPWLRYCQESGILGDITGIFVDEHITSIGSYAFASFSSVTSLVMADSVARIGTGALDSLHIDALMLPKALTTLGEAGSTTISVPLINSPYLKTIEVRTGNTAFCVQSNVLYMGKTAIMCPDGYDGEVEI